MSILPLSDRELVARILGGHPDQFGALVERHIRAAHAIAYARLGNTADAEDAVQEAFLRAYERLGSLRDPNRFAAWLLTIARHEAARVAVKRNRTTPPSDLSDASWSDPSDESDPSTHPNPAQHELNTILREHLARLPESAREVLLLHYFAGHSAREIAALLDLRRAAVLKRLQRAREQLAETMLRDLETTRPSEASLSKQAMRIGALASALALPSATVGSVAVAAGIGLSVKAALASIALLTAVAGIGVVAWRAHPSPERAIASTNEKRALVSPSRTNSINIGPNQFRNPTENVTEDDKDPESAPKIVEARSSSGAKSGQNQYKTLTGTWSMEVVGPKGAIDEYTVAKLQRIHLEDNGDTIDVMPVADGLLKGRGEVRNDRVYFDLESTERTPVIDPKLLVSKGRLEDTANRAAALALRIEGPLTRAASEMTLSGTSQYPRYDFDQDGNITRVQIARVPVEMKWHRIPLQTIDNERFTDAKAEELAKLARAIFDFSRDYGGRGPAVLQELVPNYLPSLQPYTREEGCDLIYTAPRRLASITSDTDYNNSVVDGRERQARMVQVEANYRASWGDLFLSVTPMVEAFYDRNALKLVVTDNGQIGPPGSAGCRVTSSDIVLTPELQEQRVASCQNNMKQLGLSLKMFMNEDREKRGPAGWYMMYPEYVPDRCILVCPGSDEPAIAYELLFPAVTVVELEATFDALFGKDYADAIALQRGGKQSHIPVAIEVRECSGSGGRNVLFLDGHTEHRQRRLDSYSDLAPFLNLK